MNRSNSSFRQREQQPKHAVENVFIRSSLDPYQNLHHDFVKRTSSLFSCGITSLGLVEGICFRHCSFTKSAFAQELLSGNRIIIGNDNPFESSAVTKSSLPITLASNTTRFGHPLLDLDNTGVLLNPGLRLQNAVNSMSPKLSRVSESIPSVFQEYAESKTIERTDIENPSVLFQDLQLEPPPVKDEQPVLSTAHTDARQRLSVSSKPTLTVANAFWKELRTTFVDLFAAPGRDGEAPSGSQCVERCRATVNQWFTHGGNTAKAFHMLGNYHQENNVLLSVCQNVVHVPKFETCAGLPYWSVEKIKSMALTLCDV